MKFSASLTANVAGIIMAAAFISNSTNMERARETLSKFTAELKKLKADKERALL